MQTFNGRTLIQGMPLGRGLGFRVYGCFAIPLIKGLEEAYKRCTLKSLNRFGDFEREGCFLGDAHDKAHSILGSLGPHIYANPISRRTGGVPYLMSSYSAGDCAGVYLSGT